MKRIKLQHRVPFWKRWFYNLSARCDLDYLREKKFTDVLTYDEVIGILRYLRPHYRYMYDFDLSHIHGSNRIVFLYHLVMRMTDYRREEQPVFDLAMIENECVGLSRTLFYVKTRFPRTPVHQILLEYVNHKAMTCSSDDTHPVFKTRTEVRDAFRKAYLSAQTDYLKYIETTALLPHADLLVSGWDDTYADVRRCVKGYIEGDETYIKAAVRGRACGNNLLITYQRQRAFYQAVLDGKFDNVCTCMRFYRISAAGLLLSHEMGVLPFELDEIVLWYLESEIQHDIELVWRLESVDRVCYGKYSCCLSELPYSLEYRLRAGQGTAPFCVRLLKGWRYADNELHNLDAMTVLDGSEFKHFCLKCEILEDGVKGSIIERTHQVVLYTAMTDDEYGKHVWDVWENEEGLTRAAKWYRTNRTKFGEWLWNTLSMFNGLTLRKAVHEWEERNM